MARFRGLVRGHRGEAHRLGGTQSGLTAEADGWKGGVRVTLFDHSGADWARVTLTGGSTGSGELLIYEGPIDAARADRIKFVARAPKRRPLKEYRTPDDKAMGVTEEMVRDRQREDVP